LPKMLNGYQEEIWVYRFERDSNNFGASRGPVNIPNSDVTPDGYARIVLSDVQIDMLENIVIDICRSDDYTLAVVNDGDYDISVRCGDNTNYSIRRSVFATNQTKADLIRFLASIPKP